MSRDDIYIVGRGCLTAAGSDFSSNWQALVQGIPCLKPDPIFGVAGRLSTTAERMVDAVASRGKFLGFADRAAHLGMLAARESWMESRLDSRCVSAIVIGSSRGTTHTLEREYERFLERGNTSAYASPASTAGSLASVLAQDLDLDGPILSVSSTCATGLVAIGTAFGLLKAGLAEQALAGACEAPLTAFTQAQLHAARVLDPSPSLLFPSRPMHPDRNGMVAGEGAACLALATGKRLHVSGALPLARIAGYGAATETASPTGISASGNVLVKAIQRAIDFAEIDPFDIDLIVGHGSGTRQGDDAEMQAYKIMFGTNRTPPLTFHKWLTGHMLGASAAFSAAIATVHLTSGQVPPLPYWDETDEIRDPKTVLVTALGFGGVAAALILARD